MIDKEMAEEYSNKTCGYVRVEIQQAFLAGLKAGRPQWHKVADGDLPKENQEVLVFFTLPDKSKNVVTIAQFKNNDFDIVDLQDVIAWKEIVLPELKESE